MDKQTIDALYGDFQRIGAHIEWMKNSTAYRVAKKNADQKKFDAAVAKWKANGVTLVVAKGWWVKKPFMDVDAARMKLAEAKAERNRANDALAIVKEKIQRIENEYTAAVKAANKANGDVSRAEAALRMALAKAKK